MAGRVSTLFSALSCVLALSFVGCSSDEERSGRDGHVDYADRCGGARSCGACTPIVGCGWCAYADGTGACAAGPSMCTGSEFRWNWEPSGCPTSTSDGGTSDGGTSDAPKTDSTPSDAAADASGETYGDGIADGLPLADGSDATSSDATCNFPSSGLNGCVPTTGGSLCGASQYALGCHSSAGSTPAPDASLKCTLSASTSDASFYCCPCN